MRFGCSLLHHCSSPPRMQAGRFMSPFTGSSHVCPSFRTFLGHNVGVTSLRVRVIRQAWGCLPGTDGLQRFTHFPAAGRRCFCFNRLGGSTRQCRSGGAIRFPAPTQGKSAEHPYWLASVFSASQVRVMELILRDRRGAGRLQECSPNSFCETVRRFTFNRFADRHRHQQTWLMPSRLRLIRPLTAPSAGDRRAGRPQAGVRHAEPAPAGPQRPAGRDAAG